MDTTNIDIDIEIDPKIDDNNSFDSSVLNLSAMLSSAPPCPGLIRNCPVPPPIPMQWQLTVPSESDIEDNDNEIITSPSDYDSDSFINSHRSHCGQFSFSSFHSIQHSSSLSSQISQHSLHSINPEWMHEMNEYHQTSSTPINIQLPSPIPIIKDDDINNKDNDDIKNKESLITNKQTILRILNQFDDDKKTQKNIQKEDVNKYESDCLMNGYIRRLQKELKQIIPTDINNICQEFYYEPENKYIHLTYNLYQNHQKKIINDDNNNNQQNNKTTIENDVPSLQMIESRPWKQNTFSGKELIHFVLDILNNDRQFVKDQNDIKSAANLKIVMFGDETLNEICDNLIYYGLIECVSYKTNFSSLFEPKLDINKQPTFKPSTDYIYNFTSILSSAIKEFQQISD